MPRSSPASIALHPIHPMIVNLPLGLWSFSVASDYIALAKDDEAWETAADKAMLGGIVGASFAAIPGLIDLITMRPGTWKKKGILHATLNSAALVSFILNYIWRKRRKRRNESTGLGPVALSTATLPILAGSAWLGGSMVYVHGRGVHPVESTSSLTKEYEPVG
jgi:uncharacterized membrane protein